MWDLITIALSNTVIVALFLQRHCSLSNVSHCCIHHSLSSHSRSRSSIALSPLALFLDLAHTFFTLSSPWLSLSHTHSLSPSHPSASGAMAQQINSWVWDGSNIIIKTKQQESEETELHMPSSVISSPRRWMVAKTDHCQACRKVEAGDRHGRAQ